MLLISTEWMWCWATLISFPKHSTVQLAQKWIQWTSALFGRTLIWILWWHPLHQTSVHRHSQSTHLPLTHITLTHPSLSLTHPVYKLTFESHSISLHSLSSFLSLLIVNPNKPVFTALQYYFSIWYLLQKHQTLLMSW